MIGKRGRELVGNTDSKRTVNNREQPLDTHPRQAREYQLENLRRLITAQAASDLRLTESCHWQWLVGRPSRALIIHPGILNANDRRLSRPGLYSQSSCNGNWVNTQPRGHNTSKEGDTWQGSHSWTTCWTRRV